MLFHIPEDALLEWYEKQREAGELERTADFMEWHTAKDDAKDLASAIVSKAHSEMIRRKEQ